MAYLDISLPLLPPMLLPPLPLLAPLTEALPAERVEYVPVVIAYHGAGPAPSSRESGNVGGSGARVALMGFPTKDGRIV